MAGGVHQVMEWRFYVYELRSDEGELLYIGKGSGDRLRAQCSKHRCRGSAVAYFRRERDAYAFEREMIAETKPPRNKHSGGGGKRATPRRARRLFDWEREMAAIGTQAYAARTLLRLDAGLPASTLEALRKVAYG